MCRSPRDKNSKSISLFRSALDTVVSYDYQTSCSSDFDISRTLPLTVTIQICNVTF